MHDDLLGVIIEGTMYEAIEMLVVAFTIGLTGALAPGPTLVGNGPTPRLKMAGLWVLR